MPSRTFSPILDSQLRTARALVVPQIPDLAPMLNEDPFVVRAAVCSALEAQNVNPATVREADLNKTERHAYSAFAIGQLRQELIEGTKSNARFIKFPQRPDHPDAAIRWFQSRSSPENKFKADIQHTLNRGAERVEDTFTFGPSPDREWWPAMAIRYRYLGWSAFGARFDIPGKTLQPTAPTEGINVGSGLRSAALSSVIPFMLALVKEKVPENERVAAAHDLAHLVTGHAAVHFADFSRRNLMLRGNIIQNEQTGKYQIVYPHGEQPAHKRAATLPSATLKCPAHVNTEIDPHAATRRHQQETNLQGFVHAAINIAPAYDLL